MVTGHQINVTFLFRAAFAKMAAGPWGSEDKESHDGGNRGRGEVERRAGIIGGGGKVDRRPGIIGGGGRKREEQEL